MIFVRKKILFKIEIINADRRKMVLLSKKMVFLCAAFASYRATAESFKSIPGGKSITAYTVSSVSQDQDGESAALNHPLQPLHLSSH